MVLRGATFYIRGATLKFQYFLLLENEIKLLGKLASGENLGGWFWQFLSIFFTLVMNLRGVIWPILGVNQASPLSIFYAAVKHFFCGYFIAQFCHLSFFFYKFPTMYTFMYV